MERIFLCLLCLSGWSVSSCFPRQYRYVNDPMTWTEAQTYCREKYIDLATAESPEEMDQLKSSVPPEHQNGFVWFGMYSKIQWKWSDGYNWSSSDYRNWITDNFEPNFDTGAHLCIVLNDGGLWGDQVCAYKLPSICYRGTQQDPEYFNISRKLSWSDAQKNCRENYVDLVTVKSNAENQELQSMIPTKGKVWMGLYRDPDIFWSDGSRSSFQYWAVSIKPLGSMTVVCGTARLPDSGKWDLKPCEETFPFVCYSSGSKHVIKLRMKPDDPSVDLNHPAVKAGLLRELQARLKESGLSGVTLKWREQPDSKVFHQEGESSQEKEEEKCELQN